MKFLCLYDFDTPLYGASAVLQDSFIKVKHIKSGKEKYFKNITEFNLYIKDINLRRCNKDLSSFLKQDFEIDTFYERNKIPFSIAQEHILSSINCIKSKDWCKDLKLVIGGRTNFRKELDPEYKMNRVPKPIMLHELRDWLKQEFRGGVIVSEGCEADDVLSIYGHWGLHKAKKSGKIQDNKICLIGIDKDLFQIPSWFYHFRAKHDKPEWISEQKAFRYLCLQLLQGDYTDNIKGLEGVPLHVWKEYTLSGKKLCIGAKNASKLLIGCESIPQYRDRVISLYMEYFCDLWEEEFQKQYQLVKLQEKKDEIPNIKNFIEKV